MRYTFLILSALALLAGPGSWQAASEGDDAVYTGVIVDAGGLLPRASSTSFTLHIASYTPDHEVERLAKLLAAEGSAALERELRNLDVGWIRVGTRLGYPLSVARVFQKGEGKVVRVITDRPLQFFEVRNQLRSADYPLGILELELDGTGRGQGRLIAAAKLGFEGTDLKVEFLGIEPFQLMGVQRVEKKPKKR